MSRLRVGLYFPIHSGGHAGGVEQFLIGLVDSLADGHSNNEYVLITNPSNPRWIESYAGSNMEIRPRPWHGIAERLKRIVRPVKDQIRPLAKPIYDTFKESNPTSPADDGFFEELGLDVVHFPTQEYVKTSLPSIYNPHDLQHLHYPEFFTRSELKQRRQYRTACLGSDAVAVPSNFVKDDVVAQYDVNPADVYVIPRGPPVEVYEPITDQEISRTRSKYSLPDTFIFYPAQTWPHKNHRRLVEAIDRVRTEYNQGVSLVCTGKQNDHWSEVKKRISELQIHNLVNHLGFVTKTELRALYRESQFVIFPSLFEGGGFPVLEAWYEGAPVACSNTTALAEKGGEAARLFDPTSVKDIAAAIHDLSSDSELRSLLAAAGEEELASYDWETTGSTYATLYRAVAEHPICDRGEQRLQRARAGTLA